MLGASKYIVLDLSEVFSGKKKKLIPRQSLKHMNRNCTFFFLTLQYLEISRYWRFYIMEILHHE